MTIKYFSMFSGIGGFEVGMKNSRYGDELECVGFSEVNKYAISIYSRWFPNHRNFGDATTIDTSELDDFSLLIGGFPCQPFSICGKQQGLNDVRGTLFFEIARVLKDKRPKYFLFENVKGLVFNNGGGTFKTILGVLSELGYDVLWQTYNSCHYGVPQHRQRLFIKGYSREQCGHEILDVGETVAGSEQREEKVKQENDEFIIRRLTPIECERLQGFEDNYTKYGCNEELISDSQRYRLLGNAVTTNVVEHIFNKWDLNVETKG